MSGDYQEMEERCKSTIEHFTGEVGTMRGGRASTGMLENVQVDYYGAKTPLRQLGLISAPEPRLLTVQVYDQGAVESVEKGIMTADLGLNPQRDGNIIRINIPALTEERRKDLIRKLHKMAEDARIALRSHRRTAIDTLKEAEKKKEISEDDLRRGEDEIQKVLDGYVKEVDKILATKETEMMAM